MEHEAAEDRQDTAATLRIVELERMIDDLSQGLLRIKSMAIGNGIFRIADVVDKLLLEKQQGVSEK